MPEATDRLARWMDRASTTVDDGLLTAVRGRLDDDLDTPGAIELIDEAAGRGYDVQAAASLFGVTLH
jgi:L-cysteine:1D-myo-inositol 2-amino-2-deoxy-alpha-D-glucopyranoside ligase